MALTKVGDIMYPTDFYIDSTSMPKSWDKYNKSFLKLMKINTDGSYEVEINVIASDHTNTLNPAISIDNGGWEYLNGTPRGTRSNPGTATFNKTFKVPAGSSSLKVKAYVDWELVYNFRNGSGDRDKYWETSPPAYLYGKKVTSSLVVFGSNDKGKSGLNSVPNVGSLSNEEMLEIFKLDKNNWKFVAGASDDPDRMGHYGAICGPWVGTGSQTYTQFGMSGRNLESQVLNAYFKNRSTGYVTAEYDLNGGPEAIDPGDLIVYEISHGKSEMKETPTINEYDGDATPWWEEVEGFTYKVSNCSFVSDKGDSKSITIVNGQNYTEFGTYNFTLTRTGTGGETASVSIIFKVKDDQPPKKFKIIDDVDPTNIIYDMTGRLYLGPCNPTVDKFEDGVEYEAKLTFYPYLDNMGTVSSTAKYKNAYYQLATPLTDSGYYELKVTATKLTNDMDTVRKVNFYIDNLPPDPPIINVAGTDYQGVFGEVAKIPNPVVVKISVQKGCTFEQEVYFKKRNADQWQKINHLDVYTEKGYYKITAIATKTSNGLKSDPSEVVFQKKIKYNWLITIDPTTDCYRTYATIHFDNDYSLKKMYKIDNGNWNWYLGPIPIYENCTFYAKSLDGDDDYESNITSKVIDVIDTSTPDKVKLNVKNGDVGSIIVPNIIK